MATPAHLRGYTRSRESSGQSATPQNIYPYPQAVSLSPTFEERFPQASTSFSLPHARTPSSSSSNASFADPESNRHTGAVGGDGATKHGGIPRTTSASTWGDFAHDVELLLGEEGRGKSPSRNGPRSATPSRSHSHASVEETLFPSPPTDRPSTPRSNSTARNPDQDTTPKGQTDRSASRPLHTPPQMFPSPSFGRTSFESPTATSRSRMSAQVSSSALRPPSAHSSSSNSSVYSLEDNSWANEFAPGQHYEDEIASVRSPLFSEAGTTSTDGPQQARPLSEFDFAAAYARSDGGSSLPNSPMLPTVGVVQPASPVAPSPTRELVEESQTADKNGASVEGGTSDTAPAVPIDPTSSGVTGSTKLLHTAGKTTPSSSRAPSPSPSLSLSPNNRPSSRASSNRSVSSPVRPPRRVASNVSLATKASALGNGVSNPQEEKTDSAPPPSSSDAVSSTSTIDPTMASPSKSASTSPNLASNQSAFSSPRGSPRPPSIPEKSRRRASTLGLGLRQANGRSKSDTKDGTDGGGASSRPASVLGSMSGFSNPNTPLSASDFAEVYGKLPVDDPDEGDRDGWDRRSASSSSPVSQRTKPTSTASSLHTRDAASGMTLSDSIEGDDFNPSRNHMREETIKARGERDDVFRANDTHSTAPNGSGGTALPENLAPTTRESPKTSRSSTPKGDAKARAAAFIADLKRSRQEAEKASADTSAVENANRENVAATEDPLDRTHDPVEHDPGVHDRDRERLEEEDTVTTASFVRDEPKHNRLGEASRQTVTETRPPLQPRSQPSSRSSTLLHSPRYPQPGHSSGPVAQPPLLRRRPLPMAIQASGELQRARTAGERVRIYAMKINELNAEKSRLDEWIDAVRVPHPVLAGRANGAPAAQSPLKTARSFRQDASTATFAPRGDGYRAKEIVPSPFGPRDFSSPPPSAPYPGVIMSYTANLTSTISNSSQRSLGSGLPSSSGGGGKSSFFSRSLGRRTSKRDPPLSQHGGSTATVGAAGGGIAGLPISNPSPLLYSSSASTTTAPQNLRPVGGPRMPGALNSRASFESRMSPVPATTPSYLVQPLNSATANPYVQHNYQDSAPCQAGSDPATLPNSPNSFSSMSTSASPLVPFSSTPLGQSSQFSPSSVEPSATDDAVDAEALARLRDVLPQAPTEDLIKSLKKAGGADDILAISIYLSEREASLK